MRRLILAAIAAVLLLVASLASAQSYRLDLSVHATDAAALAYVQARLWDTNADGTGDPQLGMRYLNSTLTASRIWDGTQWVGLDYKGPGTATTITVCQVGCDYQTIAAALAVASAGYVVIIYDGSYTEDITVPDQVRVWGPTAGITGTIALGANTTLVLQYLTVPAGQTGITTSGLAGNVSMADINAIIVGDGGSAFITPGASAGFGVLYVQSITLGAGSYGFGDGAAALGQSTALVDQFLFSGANAVAIDARGGASMAVEIKNVTEIGANGTIADVDATSALSLNLGTSTATNTFDVAAGGGLLIKIADDAGGSRAGYAIINGVFTIQPGDPVPAATALATGTRMYDENTPGVDYMAIDVGGTNQWQVTTIGSGGVSWYVSSTIGNDAFDCASPENPCATIAAGLALAGSGDAVHVAPATYTEDVSVPTGVQLRGPSAGLTGEITQADDSTVELYSHIVPDGDTGITLAGVNTEGVYSAEYLLLTGSADGYTVTDSASTLFLHVGILAVTAGEGHSSAAAGSAVVDIDALLINGGGTGISTAATSDVTGRMGVCADSGAGTCFNAATTSSIVLSMETLASTTAWVSVAGAEIVLTVGGISGTRTGLAKINGEWWLPSGLAIATWIPADSSVVTVAEGDVLYWGTNNVRGTLEDLGGTPYWVGPDYVVRCFPSESGRAASVSIAASGCGLAPPPWATSLLFREAVLNTYVQTTNTAAHYWQSLLRWEGVDYGGVSTGTTPDAPTTNIYHRQTVEAIIPMLADGDTLTLGLYHRLTKTGTPGNFSSSQGPDWIMAGIME